MSLSKVGPAKQSRNVCARNRYSRATDLTRALTVPGAPAPHPPSHRALLIGINAYPDPINQLNGCASDTYLVSELLQENGFVAENIRLLTDERATRDAILDRLHWLLDDVADESMAVRQAYSGTSGTSILAP